MKGIVFTEFLEMVEQVHGYPMVDRLLSTTELPSQGVYTAVGTYNHQEMVHLVVNLAQLTNTAMPDLLRAFGEHLFRTFTEMYGHFMEHSPDAFTFFASIDTYIHVEVRKLYPEAELPHFETTQIDANTLVMTYQSARKMGDLALGLIQGTLDYYGQKAHVSQEQLKEDGTIVKFIITKY